MIAVNAAINGRSSTNPKSSARSTVEERPFRAASDAPPSTLSSLSESRDLAFAGDEHERGREFSPRTPLGDVRGENASPRHEKAQADTRSFDSAARTASGSVGFAQDDNEGERTIGSAQDDSVGEGSDVDIFRAFVKAGRRHREN